MADTAQPAPNAVPRPRKRQEDETDEAVQQTVIGWQGIRFKLPPEWSLTSFSMEKESGYLRVNAPGESALTVQIRWQDASTSSRQIRTLYDVLAPRVRKLFKRPSPPVPPPELKKVLEKVLKDTAKSARKAGGALESSLKPERVEGENGERTAIAFQYSGGGKGQGKIWHCHTCNRLVIAQIAGIQRESNAIQSVAAQLFATLYDHSSDGFDLWALFGMQAYVPESFRLHTQRVFSGHLRLVFLRNGEKIVIDRWGLADTTLKRFQLEEWFQINVPLALKRMEKTEETLARGHSALVYKGAVNMPEKARIFREARGLALPLATLYEGGVWHCVEENKIYAVQTYLGRKSEPLMQQIMTRCLCHL